MSDIAQDLRDRRYLCPKYEMVSYVPHDPGQAQNCGNYWLYTAEAKSVGYDPVHFWDFYIDSQTSIGLFTRHPEVKSNISKDELIGAAAISPAIALHMLMHAERNRWCFNAERPGKFEWRYWVWRFLDVPAFIRIRAEGKMTLVDRLLWSIACERSCRPGPIETSGKKLMYVQIPFVEGKYWLCDQAIRFWRKTMTRKYPGGPKQLMTEYFGVNHPTAERSNTHW